MKMGNSHMNVMKKGQRIFYFKNHANIVLIADVFVVKNVLGLQRRNFQNAHFSLVVGAVLYVPENVEEKRI